MVALSELAAELTDERHRLDVMEAADGMGRTVRTVFSWSIRYLSPTAARYLQLLGLHPGRDFDPSTLAALCGTDLADAQRYAGELVQASLLEEDISRRYQFHDLLRAYASEQATTLDEAVATHARTRLFDHLQGAAAIAMDAAFPEEAHLRPHVPAQPTVIGSFTAKGQALAWLDAERDNLVAVAAEAASSDWHQHACNLSAICWRYFTNTCHHASALTLHTAAVQAARRDGDFTAETRAVSNLASVDWALGQPLDAITNLERATELARHAGDRTGECRALENLAGMYWQVGRYIEGANSYEQSLELRGGAGKRPHEHFSHPNLAAPCERFGRIDEAVTQASRAIILAERFNDRVAAGYGYCVIGVLRRLQGRYAEALDNAQHALAASKETGYRFSETNALNEIGMIQLRLGHHAEALDHLTRALALSRDTVDRANEGYALSYLGLTHLRRGACTEALTHLHQALSISHAIHDRDLQAKTLNALGECSASKPTIAMSYHRQVISLTDETGNRYERARAHAGLGDCCRADGDPEEAEHHRRQALAMFDELGVAEAAQLRSVDGVVGQVEPGSRWRLDVS